MAKETCDNCYVKLAQPVSFCPSCNRPTRHANDSERLEWDLRQWRSHVDRSVAAGMNPTGQAVGFGAAASVAVAPQSQPAAPPAPAQKIVPRIVPMPAPQSRFTRLHRSAAPAAKPAARAARVEAPAPVAVPATPQPARETKKRRLARSRRPRPEPATIVERDRDHEFAYRTCASCDRIDWIVRCSQNDDETWNYWCLRCSRSFKTEVRLAQALKPFLSGGIVVGGLTAASLLLFR
jgi:hypothetical protein